MALENPYRISSDVEVQEAPAAPKAAPAATAQPAPSAEVAKASEATFREAALEKGVHTTAIDALVEIVKTDPRLGGDFDKGLEVLASKSTEELNAKYGPEPNSVEEQW